MKAMREIEVAETDEREGEVLAMGKGIGGLVLTWRAAGFLFAVFVFFWILVFGLGEVFGPKCTIMS